MHAICYECRRHIWAQVKYAVIHTHTHKHTHAPRSPFLQVHLRIALKARIVFFSPVCCQPSADCIATDALEICCCCNSDIITIAIVVASMQATEHNVCVCVVCACCTRQSLRFTFRLSAHSRVLSGRDSRISVAWKWCNLRENNLKSRKWKSRRNYFHCQIILKILHYSYFL